jgi:hypothetical protein
LVSDFMVGNFPTAGDRPTRDSPERGVADKRPIWGYAAIMRERAVTGYCPVDLNQGTDLDL